jgi:hypothetical protein
MTGCSNLFRGNGNRLLDDIVSLRERADRALMARVVHESRTNDSVALVEVERQSLRRRIVLVARVIHDELFGGLRVRDADRLIVVPPHGHDGPKESYSCSHERLEIPASKPANFVKRPALSFMELQTCGGRIGLITLVVIVMLEVRARSEMPLGRLRCVASWM